VDDQSRFVRLVRQNVGRAQPTFLMGMSMGGYVVVDSAIKDDTLVVGPGGYCSPRHVVQRTFSLVAGVKWRPARGPPCERGTHVYGGTRFSPCSPSVAPCDVGQQ